MKTQLRSTRDLLDSERAFVVALRRLGYGRFESLQIRGGELVIEPWPPAIRAVKFGSRTIQPEPTNDEFDLKKQVAEFFEYIRGVEAGEIRSLEVRDGLPFLMTIEERAEPGGQGRA
jgi:hypothetical protein